MGVRRDRLVRSGLIPALVQHWNDQRSPDVRNAQRREGSASVCRAACRRPNLLLRRESRIQREREALGYVAIHIGGSSDYRLAPPPRRYYREPHLPYRL